MVQVGFKSDRGLKRSNNEDACFVVPKDNVYIIADGVGGNNAGEIASRTAVSRVAEYVREHDISKAKDDESLRDYFMDCLTEVNTLIYNMDADRDKKSGRATTIVVAYITGDTAYFINVGDSRAYVCRDGRISQITEDHTYVNTLLKNGTITADEVRKHPKRNMITRALGGDAIVEPDFYRMDVKKNDVILLCTDGLHSELTDDEICEITDAGDSMSDTCAKLVVRANQKGGRDNITVICLKLS
ncbi:MAG: Stp1/IreP family PP2C-type Ser/Thr phosphatase [Clostridia bacterium]|nr:Stp1/IreP family PP2C-type Ser/Thr phosphatase [Clostridia bacterium]